MSAPSAPRAAHHKPCLFQTPLWGRRGRRAGVSGRPFSDAKLVRNFGTSTPGFEVVPLQTLVGTCLL
eukprot:10853273-Lingulodinium_polyedra.AAC.1